MTTQEKIDQIRAKCIEANPSIETRDYVKDLVIVRLADLLLAIDKSTDNPPTLTCEGQFCRYDADTGQMHLSGVFYSLRQDDLTKQSPEFIDFLHSLLYGN